MCEETHMTAPKTVRLAPSFFCWVTPENVVGMVTGREIMRRQRLQEREWENDRKSERQKKRKKETESGVREPADVKVPLITSCFSSAPSFCLSLSVPPFLSFPLEFLSQRFNPVWRRVLIDDNNRDASVKAHTNALYTHARTHEFKCHCKLKAALAQRGHAHTHIHELLWTQLTQQWPLSECSSQGIMTAFCSNHS